MSVSRVPQSNPSHPSITSLPPAAGAPVERTTRPGARSDAFEPASARARPLVALDGARPLAAVDLSKRSGAGLSVPQVDLAQGDTGEAVRQLQECLVALGFMTQAQMNTGPGIFGPQTEGAVKAFQSANGVQPVSGYFGPLTRGAMERALGGTQPQPAPQPGPQPAPGQWDGTHPAPGTTDPAAWNAVDAPTRGDPNNRNAATYDDVINQFAVGVNQRYTPRNDTTFCNIFAWDVTRAMGAEIPHYVDGNGNPTAQVPGAGRELDANGVNRWLNQSGSRFGWRQVSAQEAQALANQGHPVVASWNNAGGIGHIGVVRPGELNGNGPAMAQAGAQNFNHGHVYDTFPRGGTQFFVNDTGRVGGGGQPAPTPTTEAGKLAADAYRSVLRREPDAGGLDNWTGVTQQQLDAGMSKEQVAGWLDSQFRGSDEYKALAATDQAFRTVLGRDVSDGRGYWHEQAVSWQREGVSLPEISNRLESALKGSKEYALQHVDEVVSQAFQETLGRPSDVNDYWHQVGRQMVNDGKSLDDVKGFMVSSFKGSEEYQLNHLDELVNGVYQELLGRDADPGGLAAFTGMANDLKAQGKSAPEIREAVAGQIRASDEFKSKQGGVTLEQLRAIMPNLPVSKAQEYLPYLNQAMAEAEINTPARKAAFLAQLAHESVELRYMEEIASGAEYEGRKDLGNVNPGDGVRYKGRGPIQLTGRSNYRSAGAALGLDLENNPTRAADPDIAFRIAGWYWTTHNLNAKADAGNFDGITLAINGGYNGKASRDAYWAKAKQVLGA